MNIPSLLLICGLSANTLATSKPIPSEAPVVAAIPFYEPANDSNALAGQALYNELEKSVWGIQTNQTVWNLDLDFPITNETEITASGYSRTGLPLNIDFATIRSISVAQDGRVGIWSGKISFSGEYYCQGLYVKKDGRATLIPIYAFVNQAEALQIYNMIVDISGGIINHSEANMHCVMDIPATFQNDQNKLLLSSCIKKHERTATQIMVTCTVIGIGTCWWTAGVGCLAGITCVTSLAINEIF